MAHTYGSFLFQSASLLEPVVIKKLSNGNFFIKELTNEMGGVIQVAYENEKLLYGGTIGNTFQQFIELIIPEYNMPSLNFLRPTDLYDGYLYSIVHPHKLSKLIEDLKSLLNLLEKSPRKTLRMCIYGDENNSLSGDNFEEHQKIMEHLNSIPDENFYHTQQDVLDALLEPMLPFNKPLDDQLPNIAFAFSYIKSIIYLAESAKKDNEYIVFLQSY